jgi:hypothetical protein
MHSMADRHVEAARARWAKLTAPERASALARARRAAKQAAARRRVGEAVLDALTAAGIKIEVTEPAKQEPAS